MRSLCTLLAFHCLSLSLLPAVRSAGPTSQVARARLKVLVVEGTAESVGERREGPAPRPGPAAVSLGQHESLDVRSAVWGRVDDDDLRSVRVIVAAPPCGSITPRAIESLRRAVNLGRGLVILGGASAAWPDSPAWDELGGRAPATTPANGGETGSLAVAVVDQRHPITQCVTHFLHSGHLPAITPRDQVQVLARAMVGQPEPETKPRFLPVLWLHGQGLGRVAVNRLSIEEGPSRGLAAVILARCVEWAGRQAVTIPLGGDVRWAAAELGPGDTGLRPGLPPARGFYRGREVASTMSYHGADWLIRPDRAETEEPDRTLDSLGIRPGDTVADLGAGNGYFTLRMSRRVGEKGRVLAVDIQPEMLDLLRARMAREGIENVEPVLATETDPRLPAGEVDLVLLVDVYHEISRPAEVLAAVRRSLSRRGRLVLVEYRGEDPTVEIKPLHRMTEAQARAELEAQGFRWIETKSFLRFQHILIFARADGEEPGEGR